MKIIPALLTDDRDDLITKIRQCESFCDTAQIDIMDGQFVPSKSITAKDFADIKTNLFLEVHLMVSNPEDYFINFKNIGAKRIIFHYEATDKHELLLDKLKDINVETAIALNPETPVEKVVDLLPKLDMLLLMAVVPGYYGSEFIPSVLDKAKKLSSLENKNFILALDGGVKLDNLKLIASCGVDQANVGSAIFKAQDPGASYQEFSATR